MNIPGIPPLYDHELMPQKVSHTLMHSNNKNVSSDLVIDMLQPNLAEYIVFMLDHVLRSVLSCSCSSDFSDA